jgi:hypothetical protein
MPVSTLKAPARESCCTPRAVTLVAVDIAKSCHDVLIEPPAPARRRRFRVANTLEEYQREKRADPELHGWSGLAVLTVL